MLHDSISGLSYENLLTSDGCAQRRIQVDCIAKDKDQAENLREQVRLVTSTYRGAWGTSEVVTVHGANVATLTSGMDDPRDGSDEPRFRRIIDILVDYVETIANPSGA